MVGHSVACNLMAFFMEFLNKPWIFGSDLSKKEETCFHLIPVQEMEQGLDRYVNATFPVLRSNLIPEQFRMEPFFHIDGERIYQIQGPLWPPESSKDSDQGSLMIRLNTLF